MGANGSKSARSNSSVKGLTEEEIQQIRKLFNSLSEPKVAKLNSLWKGKMDHHLEQLVMNYLSKSHKNTTFSGQDFEKLFALLVRGTNDDKSNMLFEFLTTSKDAESISRTDVQNYAESLIKSYILISPVSGWEASSASQVKCLCDSLGEELPSIVDRHKLCLWITNSPKIFAVQASVLGTLYGVNASIQQLMPTCKNFNIQSILDFSSVMFLNSSLPAALRNEWRLLFSSAKHGESFSKFIGFIQNKGPSLLIIRDKKGFVFGGFAPHAWTLSPKYAGDETTFLFSVKPNMAVYNSTGYNDHYQYLNVQQQTMPNGLGMGGQFDYWGLWLDAEFGKGHCSESCTTFRDLTMLSASKEYEIDHLEAWAVGPLPEEEETQTNTRSILDTNAEAKAILEMSGKTSHSDGWREPVEDDM